MSRLLNNQSRQISIYRHQWRPSFIGKFSVSLLTSAGLVDIPDWSDVRLPTVLLSVWNANPHELQAPVKAADIYWLGIERLVLERGVVDDVHHRDCNDGSVTIDATQQWLQPSCNDTATLPCLPRTQGRIKASAGPGAVPNAGLLQTYNSTWKFSTPTNCRPQKTAGQGAAAPLAPPLNVALLVLLT